MSRMSARYVGRKMCASTQWVYKIWKEMGLIVEDKFGDWTLTNLGMEIGGKMSKSNYCSVPTFEYEVIKKLMDNHLK